jgi:hypothetical protein
LQKTMKHKTCAKQPVWLPQNIIGRRWTWNDSDIHTHVGGGIAQPSEDSDTLVPVCIPDTAPHNIVTFPEPTGFTTVSVGEITSSA